MSCKILEIDYNVQDLYDAHEKLLQWHIKNFPEVEEWRTMLNIDRGILPLYQDMLKDEGKPNALITCFPLEYILKGKSHLYTEGIHAIVPSQRAIPHHLLDARLKTRSRQHYQMANLEIARQDKDAWPLLLDPDGFIAESTGSNFFIVKGKRLYTPMGHNCLRGISCSYIFELLNETWTINFDKPDKYIHEISIMRADITLFDVYEADEAFLTCTPYSIVPCTKINGKPIGDGKVGKVTKELTQAWIDSVDCDFVEQVVRWDKEMTSLDELFKQKPNKQQAGKPWFVIFREEWDKWKQDVLKHNNYTCEQCGGVATCAGFKNKEFQHEHFHKGKKISWDDLIENGIPLCVDCSIGPYIQGRRVM